MGVLRRLLTSGRVLVHTPVRRAAAEKAKVPDIGEIFAEALLEAIGGEEELKRIQRELEEKREERMRESLEALAEVLFSEESGLPEEDSEEELI